MRKRRTKKTEKSILSSSPIERKTIGWAQRTLSMTLYDLLPASSSIVGFHTAYRQSTLALEIDRSESLIRAISEPFES